MGPEPCTTTVAPGANPPARAARRSARTQEVSGSASVASRSGMSSGSAYTLVPGSSSRST